MHVVASSSLTRAQFLRGGASAAALLGLGLSASLGAGSALAQQAPSGRMHTRRIPVSGEMLPVIGCGTWRGFDVGLDHVAELRPVLQALFDAGGSVIDTSPMYGAAERVTGQLVTEMGAQAHSFLATKVWTHGKAQGLVQMSQSLALLGKQPIDLMQIHNLLDWRTHLPALREWKASGRIRYLGITHYTETAYMALESILRQEAIDFLQINYSVDDRAAEKRLFPLAAERGVAVLVNRPFGGGGLLRNLAIKRVPEWAGEIECTSWAQLLLKFIVAHPAVTCVIPGTSDPGHMAENAQAGFGALPDASLRERIAEAAGVA
ncbi:aldo/keto reductase [Niveibacterium sp. SC-1]|uniref:aldo/keto reductase n=1 Tax=Niveibacterium sp. SC-1 TaxID=3135646 RepID=UPI00311FEFF5